MRWHGVALLFPLALLLAGCPTRTRQPSAPPTPVPVQPLPVGEGRPYAIVAGESLLTIQVYRGGTLARVGHNHVIASHELTGEVLLNRDIALSSFKVQFPVETLTVDEPELREQAGPDFPPGVPDSAKEGTKKNLLGEGLLNASQFPTITLLSTALESPETGALSAQVQVTVRDQTRTIPVAIHYELSDEQLRATVEMPLKQSDLGLKPFSVMMGALEVKDDMQLRFSIVARPRPATH